MKIAAKKISEENTYSDIVGSMASGLCLAHCMATPLLFASHTGHVHGHHNHPIWWGLLDILFIGISLAAVIWSVKNTSKNWMKTALGISWIFLAFIILNEKLELFRIAEALVYVPSVALVGLHLYNRRYCTCGKENCCSHSNMDTPNNG